MNLPLGKWFGITVALHWSWMLLFSFIAFSNPNVGLFFGLIFFIVLLHEFGHCLAGKYYNLFVRSVTLYPFGGVALMEMPTKPQQELVVSLAGPAVNVLLIPILWGIEMVYTKSDIASKIFEANLVLLAFNMLPSFPMDGGRVFRALLAMWLKDHSKATIIAARVGQGFCGAFAILGMLVGNPVIIIVAGFIFLAAEQEITVAKSDRFVRQMHESVTGIKSPPTAERDVKESARMLEEIQRRVASFDQRSEND